MKKKRIAPEDLPCRSCMVRFSPSPLVIIFCSSSLPPSLPPYEGHLGLHRRQGNERRKEVAHAMGPRPRKWQPRAVRGRPRAMPAKVGHCCVGRARRVDAARSVECLQKVAARASASALLPPPLRSVCAKEAHLKVVPVPGLGSLPFEH